MTMRPAAPGPQLSAGRIRVDAARAIAKLREYQLADRAAWVLEAIRAAVAAQATRVELRGDSNDIWLSWEGEPLPDELLPRLFDELVSPEPATERHHVRLLAAAVNSALGMNPVHVDVTAIRDGTATRVRYTPDILAEPESELGDSALRHVATEPVAPPEGKRPGMLLHLRRRLLDWKLFGEPRELVLARDACRDISVPLHVSGLVLHRDNHADVVRIPLGDGLDGFIAVTEVERAGAAPAFEIAERSVVLATYIIELLDGKQRAPVPLRVFIDAPRMPTNASRSQVNRDAHPIASAQRRAAQLAPELMRELAKAVEQGSERARASALALIAAVVRGPRWHVDVPGIRGPLREVANLPLVKNAVGQPRALTAHWHRDVHTGKRPFDAELAPWLETVLWAPPDDPATQLFDVDAVDTRGTRRLVRWARRQLRAHEKFYQHEKRDVRVLSSTTPHVRARLGVAVTDSCIGQELFDGLDGEVFIYDEGTVGALVVLLEGRELERVEFDSPLAFDVVIDSAKVTPADRYRGVKRDAEYKRVERAMRGGIMRALEAHALARQAAPSSDAAATDARLYRKGFGVIRELGLPLRGPLAHAPAYRKIGGTWATLRQLSVASVIGYAPPGRPVCVPRGRAVIELEPADRKVFESHIPARLVPYRRETREDESAMVMRAARAGGGALVVRDEGTLAAVAPAARAQLELHHLGVELDTRPYVWHWLPCAIWIDSDALVPDESWSSITDDRDITERDYASWELALVRAIARALIGESAAELVLSEPVGWDSKLGRALCDAIVRHDPEQLLGAELLAKLRAAPLLRLLGRSIPCSIDELATLFPTTIPYLSRDAEAVDDFTPILAGTAIAVAIGKLAGRAVEDAAEQLVHRQRRALGQRLLAKHRLEPQRPVVVPVDEHVGIKGELARGVVGVWSGTFQIRVFVEGRPFEILYPTADLPLIAAVEIDADQCGDTFERIPRDVAERITHEVTLAIPALLVELARHRPDLLGDVGPARTLLARHVDAGITDEVRRVLAAAPVFHTIQGGRVSIERAAQPRFIVSVAAWQNEWLGPDNDPADTLDAPILFVPDAQDQLSVIIDKLHPGSVVDVTAEVSRLQARRRMARGLLPRPQVRSIAPALKRPLSALGEAGKRLGHGEIGLTEDAVSRVMVHEHGTHTRTESSTVMPPVVIALELSDWGSLDDTLQPLAIALVQDVLTSVDPGTLSLRIRRNLLRAALAKRIDGVLFAQLPIFFPYTSTAPTWQQFVEQLQKLGTVWTVREPTALTPLDETRHVFVLEHDELVLAREHGWMVIEASNELALDDTARRNRSRTRASSLELPATGVLAEVELSGDGVTSPRGCVGVLLPAAGPARGVWPHRAMHPFDRGDDPCRWPTVSVIDDARLSPDRTWSAPVFDETWQSITKELRNASEQALAKVGEVPDDALVSLRINNHACADVAALRKAPKSLIRGALWLIGPPREAVGIPIIDDRPGTHVFVPAGQLAMGGRLFVFAPDGLDVEAALEQLCGQVHGKLVRALLKQDTLDMDLVAGHVAHALAIRTLRATDARAIEFPCFAPHALDARGLQSLLRREDPMIVIKPNTPPNPDPDVIELVDDGSILSRVLIADLGTRVRRVRPAPQPRLAGSRVPATPEVVTRPAPARETPQPPAPPHPFRPLVKAMRVRLAELGIPANTAREWTIVERAEPMFAFADGDLEVAGNNPRLRALAAALAANSPWADAGLDVVVAHVVTVLNVALTDITDATEAHAIGVLMANRPSEGQPRSRRSS